MHTRDYIIKFQELKEKNQNQEEEFPVSLRGMYQGVLDGLSLFDEFSNDEEPNMNLIVKKMKWFSAGLSHCRYFLENTEFGDKVANLNYEFSRDLKSVGYEFLGIDTGCSNHRL